MSQARQERGDCSCGAYLGLGAPCGRKLVTQLAKAARSLRRGDISNSAAIALTPWPSANLVAICRAVAITRGERFQSSSRGSVVEAHELGPAPFIRAAKPAESAGPGKHRERRGAEMRERAGDLEPDGEIGRTLGGSSGARKTRRGHPAATA
jgi:hypothetical protein